MNPVDRESPDRSSRGGLRRGLEAVFREAIAARGPFRVVHRHASSSTSTYPVDVVVIRFADGSREELFCKYGHGIDLHQPTPHRGLAYEAEVCMRVLPSAPLPAPRVWGRFVDDESGADVLVMRHYRHAPSATRADDPLAVDRAIRWMAEFHAWGETRLDDPAHGFLQRYDRGWYELWLDRTLAHAAPLAAHLPWLPDAAAAYRAAIPVLLEGPAAIIHGEFTTRNTLWVDGEVLPIDWETAAVGAGEIDLAVFTYDWDPDDVAAMVAAYAAHRWAGSPPATFAARLAAARLYVVFHWLYGSPRPYDAERLWNHFIGIRDEATLLGVLR